MASAPKYAFSMAIAVGALDNERAARVCQKMTDHYRQCAAIWLNEPMQRYEIHIPVGDVTRPGLVCYSTGLSDEIAESSTNTTRTGSISADQNTGEIEQANKNEIVAATASNVEEPSTVQINNGTRDTRPRRIRQPARSIDHIPRPRNCWILYRSDKTRQLRDMDPSLTASDISRITSRLWAEELPHVKAHYQQKAQDEAANHLARFPNYRYRARRPIPRHPTVDNYTFWHRIQLGGNPGPNVKEIIAQERLEGRESNSD